MPPFLGFPPQAVEFLLELQANNDRAWFQPRKTDYERWLKEPLEELCLALGERFATRGIPLQADQRSPFRIYRDVRFSADKTPYKTHVSASFPYVTPGEMSTASHSAHGVGAYFHFSPDEVYAGGGMWRPERDRLSAWRALVMDHPKKVHATIDGPDFDEVFGHLEGDSLKRVPPGYPADHPDADLLRLKDVVFGRTLSLDDALSPDLPERLATTFAAATPVLMLLAELPA